MGGWDKEARGLDETRVGTYDSYRPDRGRDWRSPPADPRISSRPCGLDIRDRLPRFNYKSWISEGYNKQKQHANTEKIIPASPSTNQTITTEVGIPHHGLTSQESSPMAERMGFNHLRSSPAKVPEQHDQSAMDVDDDLPASVSSHQFTMDPRIGKRGSKGGIRSDRLEGMLL